MNVRICIKTGSALKIKLLALYDHVYIYGYIYSYVYSYNYVYDHIHIVL